MARLISHVVVVRLHGHDRCRVVENYQVQCGLFSACGITTILRAREPFSADGLCETEDESMSRSGS